MSDAVLTEIKNRVGIIRLNRPESLNAFNYELSESLYSVIEEFNSSREVGAILITGNGKAFSAGADVGGFQESNTNKRHARSWNELVNLFLRSKPIITAINGFAVGMGITLFLYSDLRLASSDAKISFRFVKIGLTPEFGSTRRLSDIVGISRSSELMLTGKFINGDQAEQIGLISRSIKSEDLFQEAFNTTQDIAKNSDWHNRVIKDMIFNNYGKDYDDVFAIENEIFTKSRQTKEHKDFVKKFMEENK
jgi:enoyl-CoA hydratase/carnithine racemase